MADTQTLIDKTTETQPGITPEGWLTDSWYLACPSKALKPGGLKHVIMLDQPIVVGRTESGEAFALRDICPHRLVPLSAGKMKDTDGEPTVECPYHGWRFGTDGVCRHMPSVLEDQPYEAGRFRVRRYPVHEKNGMIFVFIADDPKFVGEPDVPPPDFGELPDTPKFVIEETFNAHMDDAVVGLMTEWLKGDELHRREAGGNLGGLTDLLGGLGGSNPLTDALCPAASGAVQLDPAACFTEALGNLPGAPGGDGGTGGRKRRRRWGDAGDDSDVSEKPKEWQQQVRPGA